MAEFYDKITDKFSEFVAEQPMFFTATAAAGARINLSPKGMDTFRILNPNLCGYLDLSGSGNETAAHILADGRITIMFNSFTRNPMIYRLYGQGEVVQRGDAKWDEIAPIFPTDLPGARQIILCHVESAQSSCGYAVPIMDGLTERDTLLRYSKQKGERGMREYRDLKNRKSIDGLDTGLKD